MKIAIYGREFNNTVLPYVQQVFDSLNQHHASLFIFDKYYQFLSGKIPFAKTPELFSDYYDLKGKVDVLLSLGGDGTILDTVSLIRDSKIPIIGINLGRLGFLASINKDNIASAIKSLVNREFTIDSRVLLSVESERKLFGEVNVALNDLTIHRRDNSNMMIIHAYINGEFLNSYWADGLIISTPTCWALMQRTKCPKQQLVYTTPAARLHPSPLSMAGVPLQEAMPGERPEILDLIPPSHACSDALRPRTDLSMFCPLQRNLHVFPQARFSCKRGAAKR